jgi:hypothetical protein
MRQESSMSQSAQRKGAGILSADVIGYSRLMGEDEVGTLRTSSRAPSEGAGALRPLSSRWENLK